MWEAPLMVSGGGDDGLRLFSDIGADITARGVTGNQPPGRCELSQAGKRSIVKCDVFVDDCSLPPRNFTPAQSVFAFPNVADYGWQGAVTQSPVVAARRGVDR
jgi:hypothetical protein